MILRLRLGTRWSHWRGNGAIGPVGKVSLQLSQGPAQSERLTRYGAVTLTRAPVTAACRFLMSEVPL